MARSQSAEELWREFLTQGEPNVRRLRQFFRRVPSDPRCKMCSAPFRGVGGALTRLIGLGPSTMNPRFCGYCERKVRAIGGGAEVELTMLFADVRGSTGLAEGMSATEFSRLMNRFYSAATNVLIERDGLIDKLVGDEVIALYVPGYAGARHACQAIEAGRNLLAATGHGGGNGPWLPVGIGIHTGTAFVGTVGIEEGATDVTALGDAVNVTARIASQAAAGEILVSAAAMTACGRAYGELERRQLALKGHAQPVDVAVLRAPPA